MNFWKLSCANICDFIVFFYGREIIRHLLGSINPIVYTVSFFGKIRGCISIQSNGADEG